LACAEMRLLLRPCECIITFVDSGLMRTSSQCRDRALRSALCCKVWPNTYYIGAVRFALGDEPHMRESTLDHPFPGDRRPDSSAPLDCRVQARALLKSLNRFGQSPILANAIQVRVRPRVFSGQARRPLNSATAREIPFSM